LHHHAHVIPPNPDIPLPTLPAGAPGIGGRPGELIPEPVLDADLVEQPDKAHTSTEKGAAAGCPEAPAAANTIAAPIGIRR